MVKIEDNTVNDLDLLARQHYSRLIGNPLVDGINYHATSSLLGRINAQRSIDIGNHEHIRVSFWDYVLVNLNRIITGRPDELKTTIEEITRQFGNGLFSNNNGYHNASNTIFGGIVKTVFNYKSLYRVKPDCETNCAFFNLSICPYCNINEVSVITITNHVTGQAEQIALNQLDHFYPQSRHPYLSLSFFNLVPGCGICNSQLKGENNFDIDTHFNPFHKRLDDYLEFFLDKIIIDCENDVIICARNRFPYPLNAIQDFRILERYNMQKRTVYNLVTTIKNHSPKIRSSVKNQFPLLFGITESSKQKLLKANNVPIYRDHINCYVLGKLKRDISINLGVI